TGAAQTGAARNDPLGEAAATAQTEKLITTLKQKSRWTFGPRAVFFGDEDGEVSGGFVRSAQIRNYAMTTNELADLGGSSASGLPGVAAGNVLQFNFDKNLSSSD